MATPNCIMDRCSLGYISCILVHVVFKKKTHYLHLSVLYHPASYFLTSVTSHIISHITSHTTTGSSTSWPLGCEMERC